MPPAQPRLSDPLATPTPNPEGRGRPPNTPAGLPTALGPGGYRQMRELAALELAGFSEKQISMDMGVTIRRLRQLVALPEYLEILSELSQTLEPRIDEKRLTVRMLTCEAGAGVMRGVIEKLEKGNLSVQELKTLSGLAVDWYNTMSTGGKHSPGPGPGPGQAVIDLAGVAAALIRND